MFLNRWLDKFIKKLVECLNSEEWWIKVAKFSERAVKISFPCCVALTIMYFLQCHGWLEVIMGLFCFKLALACAISGGTISFGITIDQKIPKQMIIQAIYQQKIANFIQHVRTEIRRPQPEFVKRVQEWHLEKYSKEQNFTKWKEQKVLEQLLWDPLQTIHRLPKIPTTVRTIQESRIAQAA